MLSYSEWVGCAKNKGVDEILSGAILIYSIITSVNTINKQLVNDFSDEEDEGFDPILIKGWFKFQI